MKKNTETKVYIPRYILIALKNELNKNKKDFQKIKTLLSELNWSTNTEWFLNSMTFLWKDIKNICLISKKETEDNILEKLNNFFTTNNI